MKKLTILFLVFVLMTANLSCGKTEVKKQIEMEPQISQMKTICELAVMECYYHNVAKFKEEDAEGILWWKKDKHFWIEYSGIVKMGIDVSLVSIEVNDDQITITLPEATVQGCKVDSATLTKDSFIVDKNSANIKSEDEIAAFSAAQEQLQETASNDKALLAEAQQRAQSLLEDYITNIGSAIGKEYLVKWIYTDAKGNPLGTSIPEQKGKEEQKNEDIPQVEEDEKDTPKM